MLAARLGLTLIAPSLALLTTFAPSVREIVRAKFPEPPKAGYDVGWLLAGVAGGVTLGAALVAGEAGSRLGSVPLEAASALGGAMLGTTLGHFAALGSAGARIGSVAIDVYGLLGLLWVASGAGKT